MNYISNAQERAKRRKSLWNFLLIPAVLFPLVFLAAAGVFAAEALHTSIYPSQTLHNSSGVGGILAVVSPLFGALPLAMLVGNFLVWLIVPARRALDAEASTIPQASFLSSQKALLKATYILVPAAVTLTIIGSVMPWQQT